MKLHNLKLKATVFMAALLVLGIAGPALCDESYPFKEGEDWIGYLDYWKTLSPDTVKEGEFYKAEYALIAGNSGSGGYFLDREELSWLAKSVRSLKKRGITPKDNLDRHMVFRNSFWHLREEDRKSYTIDWKKIDPEKVSESDFYKAEYAMMVGNTQSDSFGYLLEQDQIRWIARAVKALRKNGVRPKDEFDRRRIFRVSLGIIREGGWKP